ncbi:hypothetical protein [Burkholderia territorii]|uniref:hypothetical protein n=1 Tax=Burkholderia territorii TaxID=1503055 RepID=UPI0012DAC758|nr:hypothetical protein [Burkholderia territorii]
MQRVSDAQLLKQFVRQSRAGLDLSGRRRVLRVIRDPNPSQMFQCCNTLSRAPTNEDRHARGSAPFVDIGESSRDATAAGRITPRHARKSGVVIVCIDRLDCRCAHVANTGFPEIVRTGFMRLPD